MYLSTQEVKDLGLKKIASNYFGEETEVINFSEAIDDYYMLLSTFKLPPFSLLSYWSEIEKLNSIDIGGFREVVYAISPLIKFEKEISRQVKGKFRNSWNSLWERFGVLAMLTPSSVARMSDVGVKLPLFLSGYEQSNDVALEVTQDIDLSAEQSEHLYYITSFYNTVLNWSTVCDRSNAINLSGVLSDIALLSNSAFCEKYTEVSVK